MDDAQTGAYASRGISSRVPQINFFNMSSHRTTDHTIRAKPLIL
ncbi:MAG: hypothetical protein ACI8VR_003192, partial [Candidatus Azotimanducaceae bacterium]